MDPVSFCVTCDVECSLGNSGTFDYPIFRPWPVDAWIWGKVGGSSQEWGIGRLMDQLERRAMKGTFYLSALQHRVHGEAAMAEVARGIEDRGHEAAVHVHCAWRGFGDERGYDLSGGFHLHDSIGDHDEATQRELLGEAVDCLQRWTGHLPASFRAGNFGADRVTLRILAELGLRTDSSRNAAVGALDDLGTLNAPLEAEGLLEVPCTVFEALSKPKRVIRFVDPTNMTVAEARQVFDQVAQMGISTLVLVTHSFQYLAPGHVPNASFRPRPSLVRRVDQILDLLADDPRFESCTMEQLGALEPDRLRPTDDLPLSTTGITAIRLVQSALDRLR